MFSTDKPIDNENEDLLKRASFAKQLAGAILSYTERENFTIGLYGEWGCGKTSILNMVIHEIEKVTTKFKEEEKPIIVQFNPWNYSDRNQLLTQFFTTILTRLGKPNSSEKLKAVGNALQKYSSALEYAEYIPVVGKFLTPLCELLGRAGEHVQEISESREDVSSQKDFVIKSLKEQKQKIIVVIDDIDRLNNEQIRLIFQLVNSLAGFPNMIYLLSFDKSVVVRALENEQNYKGEEYLEKIIQVPFEVPTAKRAAVHDVFFDRLNQIFNDIPCHNFDEEYWSIVFNNCIAHFLNSIRDVNRIINVFRFKYGLMYNETNCVDLLAITTLQICAPQIAEWILHNSNTLTGSIQSAGATTGIKQKEMHEQYFKLFSSIYESNPAIMLNVIQALFPKFGWITGGYKISHDSSDELRRKQRIANSERFDLYFRLSLEEITISRAEIVATISDMGDEKLKDYLDRQMQEGRLMDYLLELRGYVNDITVEKLPLFFREMIRLQGFQENHIAKGLLAPRISYQCKFCAHEILRRMDDEMRFNLIFNSSESADFITIPFIAEVITDCESAWGRIGKDTDNDHRYVTEEQLDILEKSIINNIQRISQTNNFLDSEFFFQISFLWEKLDQQGYESYIKNQLNAASNVPKYLFYIAGHWSRGSEKGWNFREGNFSGFITKDDAYTKVVQLKGTRNFSGLSVNFKRVCIAFYLWYGLEDKEGSRVSEAMVDALISSWEVN